MDADGSTYEPDPEPTGSREWPADPQPPGPREWPTSTICSPSMCPTCGDMPLLWTVKAPGAQDTLVSCPICHMRVRPMRL